MRERKSFLPRVIVAALLTVVCIAFTVLTVRLGVLPKRLLLPLLAVVWIVGIVLDILLLRSKKTFVLWIVFSVLVAAVLCFGMYYLHHTGKMVRGIEPPKVQIDSISVYVLKDDPAQNISDTEGYNFGILAELDRENTDKTIAELEEKVDFPLQCQEYDDMMTLADDLLAKKIDAVILNDAFVSLIAEDEGYTTFPQDIRALSTTVQEQEIPVATPEPVMDGFFIAYISGIDTFGSVSRRSNSDVNILAAVNTQTKEILLLSTPRDYFIELPVSKGRRDKLTHAGVYGVEVSMGTLEMLYGIDVNYYVRMNFSGFTGIIDAIGGVDVYSQYDFSAGGNHYQKGYNYLNGEQALSFARERHSFATGDNQRGKNQMEVIKAVIKKCSSPAILKDYAGLMASIAGTFETSVPQEKIAELVDAQLFGQEEWHVVSHSVTGSNSNDITYSMPGRRTYVMEPNWDSVEEAKELLRQVKDGEKLAE